MRSLLSVLDFIAKLATLNVSKKVEFLKWEDSLIQWVGFPWGEPEAMDKLTQSQVGLEYIGELIQMNNRLAKVNLLAEVPGKITLPGFSSKPETFWNPTPIHKKKWKSGRVAIRLMFSESPRTNIQITNKSDRLIRVGTSREVHLGGPWASYSLSQRLIGAEEWQQHHLGHTLMHYACKKPVKWEKAGVNYPGLFDSAFINNGLTATKEDVAFAQGELKNKVTNSAEQMKGLIGVADYDNRDFVRDSGKHRTQVWSRYEGVMRMEAVKTSLPNPAQMSNYKDMKMIVPDPNDTEGKIQEFPNSTPVLSDDSPQALFEIRPAEFNNENKAAMIMATPTFVLCGMENPKIGNYSLEASVDKWVAGGTEQATDDNFFAVRDKKNYKENWDNILPSGRLGTFPLASYGILGGARTIEVKTEDKPLFQGQSGLELFGENVVSIGSGLKKDGKWTSGLIVKDDIVELCQSNVNGDKKSFISMQSELLELKNEVANLKSMIRMDKDGITLSVGNTAIEIKEHRIQIFVKGGLMPVATFDEKEFKHGKQVDRVSL